VPPFASVRVTCRMLRFPSPCLVYRTFHVALSEKSEFFRYINAVSWDGLTDSSKTR